ncbi:hypothetical protein GCM10007276_31600 [Agaricicola taiwanensis]|uniref:N-acetyltransferase domain-containing protein n=1 Tax=Agaricicola taiwanensis TaxID=591372 RepID=A0A8J2YM32_9RHOB|nr:GNAT family N-acetyltransferase [Agaricicola taiwanensis]GGE52274.1 hypothetical protein GCM10007276_31600 [Agaricicola taiwanensis]
MGLKKKIKTISQITRTFLAEGENERADFKRLPDGISADDLVAFANSDGGGNILAGIDEQTVDSAQIGVIRGCDVSDATILQVLNKAVGCIPPVSIDIFIENLSDKPILRIEVPSSPTKPHCTSKGVYCRRDGARNRPLHPGELLKLFLETEASSFAARFEVAAERITEELGTLEASLDRSIQNMSDQLGWADYQLGDTESTLDTIRAMVARLSNETSDVNARLRTIFRQDKREDPIRERERLKYVNSIIKQIRDDEDLLKHVMRGKDLTTKSDSSPADITDEDAKQLLQIAADYVRDHEDRKKYAILVKSAKKCTDVELDQFAAKVVAAGGEIADDLRARVARSYRLGFITYDDVVVGTAAIKKPTANCRAEVFCNAKSDLTPADYSYELSWIFLDEPHRKKGQMTRLLKELFSAVKDAAMFATTRTSNDVMRDVLIQFGFVSNGEDYSPQQQAGETLKLFVRGPQENKSTMSDEARL